MKVVMLTYTDAGNAAEFDAWTEEAQKAWVDRHMEWFARHRDVIVDGTEMEWPQRSTAIAKSDGSPIFTDGPFPETKELLGGYIEMQVEGWDQALEIASEWPNIEKAGNRVVVMLAASSASEEAEA
jgi:hypothetical protein